MTTDNNAGTAAEVPSYLHVSAEIKVKEIRFGHAWTSDSGPHATVLLGHNNINLNSVASADALIAAAVKARDALAEQMASAPPTTPEERASYRKWRATYVAGGTA